MPNRETFKMSYAFCANGRIWASTKFSWTGSRGSKHSGPPVRPVGVASGSGGVTPNTRLPAPIRARLMAWRSQHRRSISRALNTPSSRRWPSPANGAVWPKAGLRSSSPMGNPQARLMVVGEAPGANEDRTGLPFVGQAGKFLDLLLAAVDLSRKDSVYICNVLKCRPPGNRDPMADEIELCSPFLKRQIALVAPEVILAVGTFAAQLLTGTNRPLGKLRGSVYAYEGVPLVVTYHPAALLRNAGWTRSTMGRFPAPSRGHGRKLMETASIPAALPEYDRQPPYSLEAEFSVLGGMLIDNDAVAKAIEIVDDSMFYREANRRLFRGMVRLFERGDVVDVITLNEELKNTDEVESAGGAPYLAEHSRRGPDGGQHRLPCPDRS